MRGTLGPGLERLTALQTLDLGGNAFSSSLPAEWGDAGTFPALQVLSLSRNELTGRIPDNCERGRWGPALPGCMPCAHGLPPFHLFRQTSSALPPHLAGAWGKGFQQLVDFHVRPLFHCALLYISVPSCCMPCPPAARCPAAQPPARPLPALPLDSCHPTA